MRRSICLERHKGGNFATNLVENYDQAFETRMKEHPLSAPRSGCEEIWKRHLVPQLPLAADVDVCELALPAAVFRPGDKMPWCRRTGGPQRQGSCEPRGFLGRHRRHRLIAGRTQKVINSGCRELQTVESGIKAHLDGQDLTSV